MTESLRVLLLEDNDTDAKLIRHELQRSGIAAITKRVDSEVEFREAVAVFSPDVVLSDHSLAQFDPLRALAVLRESRPTTPLIVVTGTLSGAQTIEAIRAGAEDVVLKTHLSRLGTAIKNAVSVRAPLEKLTIRQIEVLRLVAEGYRTREIADRLQLSIKTVESHRGEVMKRLGIHEVVGLVRYAIRIGLVTACS